MANLVSEIMRGKNLTRILMNEALSGLVLTGDILDLGSGSGHASHERMIKYREPYTITRTDYYRMGMDTIKLDLERPFKLKKGYDAVTCFNVLEHVYDYQNVIRESYKVLKKGGVFVATIPFLVRYHPAPEDYWRFSKTSLERILKEAGFTKIEVTGAGYGPFSCAQWVGIIPRPLRVLFYILHIVLDRIVVNIKPYHRGKYPLAFLIIAKK